MFKIILIDIKSNYKYLNVHLSNGEIKEIFLSKSFRFNWGVFKKQIEFEYFGGDLRWKSITRLTLRSILEYRVLGLMIAAIFMIRISQVVRFFFRFLMIRGLY